MRSIDYLIKALQAKTYEYREWVISCFSVTQYRIFEEISDNQKFDYMLVTKRGSENLLYFIDPDNPDTLTLLEEFKPNKPLLYYTDRVTLNPGDLPNVKKTIETTIGNCIINCYLLIYPFGDKIEFMTGKVNGNKILSIVTANLHATPDEDEERDPSKFYVDELLKNCSAATALEAFNFTCVPTTSESTMLPVPAVVKRRDELLKLHKHELDKPSVVAKIQAELANMDKAYFKNDRASGFYLANKAYDIVRMKKFIMLGMIGGFGGNKPTLVSSSLAEGWKVEDFPPIVDEIRNGSYSRGKATAVAGGDVKLVYNALQSVTVQQDDCGVKTGLSWLVTEDNYGLFDGLYQVDGEQLIRLDSTIVRNYIGKKIIVRSPMICKNSAPSFCAKCCGDSISMLPKSVHITASNINSSYMDIAMSAMHGKTLKTKKFDIFQ